MTARKPIASLWIAVLVGVFAYAQPAVAAQVLELEQNGTAINNTIATAQFVPASAFTLPTLSDLRGFPTAFLNGLVGFNCVSSAICSPPSSDRDFYSFFANGGRLIADLDGASPGDDHWLFLFDSTGKLIGDNDDGHEGDSDPHDPCLGCVDSNGFGGPFTLPGPGLYFIEVSLFGAGANGPQPFPFPIGNQRFYDVQLAIEFPVPHASSILLLGVGMGVLLVMRRSRRRAHP
jgi:hypothetical protein